MNLFNFLGDIVIGGKTIFPLPVPQSSRFKFIAEIVTFLNQALGPITVTLLAASAVFSIVIAFMIMKAESSDRSSEMKRRLWHLILTVICVLGTLWILAIVLSNIENIVNAFGGK